MATKEPSLTFSIEPFPMVDLTGDGPLPNPPVKMEAVPDQSEYTDPPAKPLEPVPSEWLPPTECLPPTDRQSAMAPPPQDPEMAWVVAQSLGTAFAVGGVVGALLAYSFSKRVGVSDV